MTPLNADYYDGKSARRIAASIMVTRDIVVVAHDGASTEYPLSSVRVQPQLKGAPRRIEFTDGSAAIVNDHAAVEALIACREQDPTQPAERSHSRSLAMDFACACKATSSSLSDRISDESMGFIEP